MVAQQNDYAPTTLGSLPFQLHKQIHDLAILGSSIQNVSCLHQGGSPARPTALVVDDSRFLEDGDQCVQIAVNITHSHNTG